MVHIPCCTAAPYNFLNIQVSHIFSVFISVSGQAMFAFNTLRLVSPLFYISSECMGPLVGLKWPGHDTDLSHKCSAEGWERVELYLHKKAKTCSGI
jgi:hypothetical protein